MWRLNMLKYSFQLLITLTVILVVGCAGKPPKIILANRTTFLLRKKIWIYQNPTTELGAIEYQNPSVPWGGGQSCLFLYVCQLHGPTHLLNWSTPVVADHKKQVTDLENKLEQEEAQVTYIIDKLNQKTDSIMFKRPQNIDRM